MIETPLDFLVVTDHDEYMGVIPELAMGNEILLNTNLGPSRTRATARVPR